VSEPTVLMYDRTHKKFREFPEKQAMFLMLRGEWEQVSHDAWLALSYAYYKLGSRWPPGEAAIAKHPRLAYEYARDVVKGQWPDGETAIASETNWAFLYSRRVICGRWLPGEAAIADNDRWANEYALLNNLTYDKINKIFT